jgi:hypothetical protein
VTTLEGRGIRDGSASWPWRYRLEVDPLSGTVHGDLVVEGWEESRAMADWAEAHRLEPVKLELEGKGVEVELALSGVRVHESGHYSETDIQVEGRMRKCP